MIKPEYLGNRDLIGIVAPARKINPEEIRHFQELISRWGFKILEGKNLFNSYHQFSGTDDQRTEDFQQMIDNPEVKAVFCARGGYGSARILHKINFSNFEKKPKWVAGFSDITVFHSYLNKFAGVETLHSLMPYSFSKEHDPESEASLYQALTGQTLSYTFESNPLNKNGGAEGIVTGGNLSMLYSLNGTIYFPDLNNKILFIEDVDEYLYHIDRMMMNLHLSGALKKVKAVVVGGMTKMNDNETPFGKTAEEIIANTLSEYNIPYCFNFPAGHGYKNHTLIFGRSATLRIKEEQCSLSFNP